MEEINHLKQIIREKDLYISKLENEILSLRKELEYCKNQIKVNTGDINSHSLNFNNTNDYGWVNLSNITDHSPFSYLLKPAPLPPTSSLNPPSNNKLLSIPNKKKSRRKKSLPEKLPSEEKIEYNKRKPRASLPPNTLEPITYHYATVIQSFIRGKLERKSFKTMIFHQLQKRRFSLIEILNAEKSYNNILQIIIKFFKNPAMQSNLFTFSEIKSIFINIDEIYESSCKFYRQLEELFTEDPLYIGHRIGILFLKMIPEWKIYSQYCNLYDKALKTLKSCKERKHIKEWFKKIEYTEHTRKLGLGDLLIAPIKRIPQYELLLKEVKNNTPKNSRHYPAIRTAKSMVSELAQYINERKKEMENLEVIKRIDESLNGSIPDLCKCGREFIDEAIVYEYNDTQQQAIEKKLFLFNDCLLIAHTSNRFDRLIYFDASRILDVSDKVFKIIVDQFSLKFAFKDAGTKASWFNNIRNFIETIKYENENSLIKDFLSDRVEPRVIKSVVIIEGILYMKKHQNRSWEKRWFVLEQGFLYYFKYKGSNKEKGFLDLSLFFLKEDKKNTSESKQRYAFELYNHKYEGLILAADSESLRTKWIQCIRPFTVFGKDTQVYKDNIKKDEPQDLLLLSSSDDNIKQQDPLGLRDSRFYFNEDSMTRQSIGHSTTEIPIIIENDENVEGTPRFQKKRSLSWTKHVSNENLCV